MSSRQHTAHSAKGGSASGGSKQTPILNILYAGSCRLHARQGFSLVEMIIAIAILSVGLLGAIRVFPVGLRASTRSEGLSRATLVAQGALEPLKLTPWSELVEGQTTSTDDPFTIVISVDQPAVAGLIDPSRLKRLAVTVTWMQEGRPRSLTMVSYLRRP